MSRVARPALVAVLVLVACAAGCGSNNTGKIVGKWKADAREFDNVTLPPGVESSVVYEFAADQRFSVSAVVTSFGKTQTKQVATGKYTLGMGNNVTLADLNPPIDGKTKSVEKITINGDTMTVAGGNKGKTITLTRMTEK